MNKKEFARRRRQLMRMIGKGGIAILPAAPTRVRSRDIDHAYRQDSDFHYLAGFPEPESVAVLVPGRQHGEFVLFCRERDPERETWDGYRAGPEGVVRDFGADDAFPIDDIDDILPGMLEHSERVYYTMGLNAEFDQRLLGWVNQLRAGATKGVTTPTEFVALDHLLHDMRLFKSRGEVAAMRKAAKIAAAAHVRAMQVCKPGMMEYEIEAEFLHEFRRHNALTSYQSIVGGGANGCVLHYVENKARLKDGDLLLIDAGCEYECYASDITRTFPVSGRFTPPQRALYDVVLEAQLAAIEKVRPGNHWNESHDAAVRVLTRGLVRLGLLKGRLPTLIKNAEYRRFYMHRTGHWLGLDVHDVGDYKVGNEWRVLEPGMVLTIEPGLYIAPGSRGVAKKWWGTGIRIEDDVLVTADGAEVLSAGAPKDPDEIERLMQAA
ncbi:MAG: Xaa-Pro aminopeptidase [Gammaproteobacteria bacterium]